MRNYETVVVTIPDASEAYIGTLTKKIEKILTGAPGEMTKKEDFGVKRMAYQVKSSRKGHYIFWAYTQTPEAIKELDHVLRYEENILRSMTVVLEEKKKKKAQEAARAAKAALAPKREPEIQSDGQGDEGGEDGYRRRRGIEIDDPSLSVILKEAGNIGRYISDTGKIAPRRVTGNNAYYQRQLAMAIKRGRQLAVLPYTDSWLMEEGV